MALPLDSPRWAGLRQAYGSAEGIPAILTAASRDLRPGNDQESPWFRLWSALCHQESVYTGSYAALPHLVELAPGHLRRGSWDPILLAGMIELSRLAGRGPPVPEDLAKDYEAAVKRAAAFATDESRVAVDPDTRRALEGSAAALRGETAKANSILDGAP